MSDDASWVRQALRGDAAAFERLVLRHTQAVRSVARAFGADWEDVVQETFFRAFATLGRLSVPEKFGEWVIGIARNVCRDERKRRARAERRAREEDGAGKEADARIAALRAAIDNLREDYRVVIEMRHFERLSYREIGDRLGLTPNGVNARLTRARAMLREVLRKFDGMSA